MFLAEYGLVWEQLVVQEEQYHNFPALTLFQMEYHTPKLVSLAEHRNFLVKFLVEYGLVWEQLVGEKEEQCRNSLALTFPSLMEEHHTHFEYLEPVAKDASMAQHHNFVANYLIEHDLVWGQLVGVQMEQCHSYLAPFHLEEHHKYFDHLDYKKMLALEEELNHRHPAMICY